MMMSKNKDLMESMFKEIENMGYHIKDKLYGDYYFVFEGDEDSVCHFHIKEIPRFSICLLEY